MDYSITLEKQSLLPVIAQVIFTLIVGALFTLMLLFGKPVE